MEIKKLTDAPFHALDRIKDEWLAHGLATAPADRAEAEAGVVDAYRAAGLEPPTLIIWLDSPLAGAVGAWMLAGAEGPEPRVGEQVRDRARNQIPDHAVGQGRVLLREELQGRVGSRGGDYDENQVWDRVHSEGFWERVRDPVRAQVRDRLGTEIPRSIAGQHDVEWLAGWDYFRAHWSVTEADRLGGIMRVARSAGRWWPFEHAVVLTERPTEVHRDEQGRLHRETGPALAYPDGFAVWSWHGVRLPRDPDRTRPAIDRTGYDFESDALVVRTDYSDDAAWRTVVGLLNQPDDQGDVRTNVVEDRAFSGASPDEVVLSTLAGDPGLEVVYLADAATMRGDHSLLAVSTRCEELDDEIDGDNAEELGREFRLLPALVHQMHVNLAIGHLDFWEFAYEAAREPDRTLRS